MNTNKLVYRFLGAVFIISTAFISGCMMPGAEMLNKVPIHSVQVEVLDAEGNPISGAQVEASNGRKSSTDASGIATIRFGTLGIHNITVLADHHMPNNMIVTMPADNGKTITARLAGDIELGSITFGVINVNLYPMMFNYLFSGYGYQLELEEYPVGGWTEWQTNEEDETTMRKAFLKKLDNGQEWWQIVMKGDEEDNSEQYIAEVLFSEERQTIVRMREKIGDEDAQEKPVSEGWYNSPQQLTEESVEGALEEENISVTVPANTFTADLLKFGVAPGMNMSMWRVSEIEVPGGIIKYEYSEEESGDVSTMELMDYGTDAISLLESF
ncbi:MAG: Ig-like domain-containing protein [Balneolaceae bacterium]